VEARRTIRLSRGDLLFGVLIVCVAVAIGLSVASLGPRLRAPATVDRADAASKGETRADGGVVARGYSFDYPSGWRMRNAGAVTQVASPQRRIVVSVGPGPDAPLAQASQRFITVLRRQYTGAHISSEARTSIEGRRAFFSTGTATTERGVKIRIVALALGDGVRPYLIAGFSDTNIHERNLRARVMGIARSLNNPEPG
jgi:hypothetical protein